MLVIEMYMTIYFTLIWQITVLHIVYISKSIDSIIPSDSIDYIKILLVIGTQLHVTSVVL